MPTPSQANRDHAARRHRVRTDHVSITVRPAVVKDATRLAEINIVTWKNAYAGIVPDTYLATLEREKYRDRWVTRITAPDDRVNLVAELDGVVAAYAIGGAYRTQHDAEPEDTSGWGELYAIYAHPDLQGKGAGRAVHDATLARLGDQGFTLAALWVLRDNLRTRRWYGDRGWRPDGASSEWLGSGVALEEIRLTRPTGAVLQEGTGP
jgi:GNAT superfamily N-acetyltransferase